LKNFISILILLFYPLLVKSQVGINNTDPKASLDITATNQANPSNTDGLLIPRIDNFPNSNPTASQDGMMVFITGNGTPSKGFYYWNNTVGVWNNVEKDDDWTIDGTTIYRTGAKRVLLGTTTPEDYSLTISGLENKINIGNLVDGADAMIIDKSNDIGNGLVVNQLSSFVGYEKNAIVATNTLGDFTTKIGHSSYSPMRFAGIYITSPSNSINNYGLLYEANQTLAYSGDHKGIVANMMHNGSNGNIFGFKSQIEGTGSSKKYGYFISIPSSSNGTHYGVYSNVLKTTGYAGYFLGRVSIGTTNTNKYIFPSTKGNNGQIMRTDAFGNLNWVTQADWFKTGGTTPPNSINDDIYTNGKVGINNPSPSSNLDIVSNSSGSIGQISVTETSANDGARILFKNSVETTNKWTLYARADNTITDNYFNIHHNTVGDILIIKGDGKVGIGSTPSYKFDVRDNSTSYVSQIYNTNSGTNADGLRIRLASSTPGAGNYFIGFHKGNNSLIGKISSNATGTGVLYAITSDRRLKTNIVSIENSLDLIDKIQPRIYEYKANLGTKEYGFIAQELQNIYPQAVSGDPNGNVETDPMMVDYSRLTPILTAGIKELKTEVEILKKENQQLKNQLKNYEDLEARLSAIENNYTTPIND